MNDVLFGDAGLVPEGVEVCLVLLSRSFIDGLELGQLKDFVTVINCLKQW